MTTHATPLTDGWAGFPGAAGDRVAVDPAATDLISVLDAVDAPIVVVQRDSTVVGFNKAAGNVLRLAASDIGRVSRDISALAAIPRLEAQCSEVIASGVESRVEFHDRDKWFVVRVSPYAPAAERTGAVLTFANVTAFRVSIDQAIYERECTKAILDAVADPLVVLNDDQRIQSGNRAFYSMLFELASLR